MKLKNYMEWQCAITQKEMDLSEYELKLCSYFERVEQKGKRGRKVAMLLTPEMTKALYLMVEKRMECGVPSKNEYLFAVPSCLTYYRGHQSLKVCRWMWCEETRFFTIYSAAQRNSDHFLNFKLKEQWNGSANN